LPSLFIFLFIILLLPFQLEASVDLGFSLKTKTVYNDNIEVGNKTEQKKTDWIYHVEPELALHVEESLLRSDIRYSLEYIRYKQYREKDQTDMDDIQRGSLVSTLFPGRKFSVLFGGEINRVTVEQSKPEDEENPGLNKTTHMYYSLNPHLKFPRMMGWDTLLDYSLVAHRYNDRILNDSLSQQIGLTFIRTFASDRYFHVSGFISKSEIEQQEDFRRDYISVGLNWGLTKVFFVRGNFGYSKIRYPDSAAEDQSLKSWDGTALWKPRSAISLSISHQRDVDISSSDGLAESETTEYKMQLGTDKLFFLSLRDSDLEYLKDGSGEKKRFVSAGYEIPFAQDLTLSLSAELVDAEYDDTDETVRRKSATASLARSGEYMDVGISYKYVDYDSDTDSNDYTNTIVSLRISYHFQK